MIETSIRALAGSGAEFVDTKELKDPLAVEEPGP